MDKLEKVIKAWECCNPLNRRCFECPYDADCLHDSFDRVAIADMVKLLKEQQEKIDGLLEDLATAIDDKDSALLMLKECDTVEHALSVLSKHGWKETDDVPYPVELLTKKAKSPTWRRGKAFCGSCGGCLENKEKHSADIVSSIRFCKWCGTTVDWSNE